MDAKLSKIYYSPKGYWKRMAAIKQLATAAKVSEFLKMRQNAGLPNKHCGKFTSQGPATSLDPSLMSRCPMPFTKPIFSSCPMINSREERRFTSTP